MEHAIDTSTPAKSYTTTTPSKSRSFSDPPAAQASLAPSPDLRERRQVSKDDHDASPSTPKQHAGRHLYRGLSLQMPGLNGDMLSPAHFPPQAPPLSPLLNHNEAYTSRQQTMSGSPATSLPRHSRGLDFSRASTNLHHSTIAEQSSPDSSPVIAHKGMMIPLRKGSMSSMMLDSPNPNGPGSLPWGSSLPAERSTVSSSVGSVNMLASESESSDSEGNASMGGDDQEDPIFTTPQVHKLQNPNAAATPFTGPQTPSGSVAWGAGSHFSPAQALRTIRRTKLQKNGRRNRKSSSSASGSGYSSLASPRTTSPPPMRSIEPVPMHAGSAGYLPWAANAAKRRRESLALGTDGLHLSSGNDSGDEASITPGTPGVVRRPVTRRGNLLPKTKGFARIRAALIEEAAPVDTEIRRESETIRQVRERDNSVSELEPTSSHDRPDTAASSPSLLPAVPENAQEDFDLDAEVPAKGLGMNFASHASRNGGGLAYWNRFDPSVRTPPPPTFPRQQSSITSDINMDSPVGTSSSDTTWRRPRAMSTASDASDAFNSANTLINNSSSSTAPVGVTAAGMNDDVHLKKFKRRREDDFDIATIKRRAVSPGMTSTQNSPVLTQSPSHREGGCGGGQWGLPPERREKSQALDPSGPGVGGCGSGNNGSGSGSRGSASSGAAVGGLASQGRKLGLQGMVDTNDGLMKMSIE